MAKYNRLGWESIEDIDPAILEIEDDDFARELGLVEVLTEHKPGKHDQKKHGKKGAGAARGDIEGHDLDQGAFGSKMGEARAVSDSIERDVLAASESAQRQIEKYESLDMDPSRFTSGLLKDALVRNIAKEAGLEYEEVNTMVAQWAESSNDTDMRSLALQRDAAAEFGIELSQFQKDKISSLEARKAQSDAMKAYAEGPMEPTREEIGEKMAEALRFGAPNRGSLTVISTLNKIEAPDAENVKGVLAEFGIRGVKNELAQNIAAAVKSGSAMSLLPAKAGNRKEDFLKRVEANERTTTPLFSSEKQRKFLRGMYDVTQRELSKRGVSEVHLIRGTRADVPTTGVEITVRLPSGASILSSRNVRADLSSMSSWTTSLSTAEGFGSTIVSARIPANRIISMYGTGFGSRGEFEWVVLGGPARVNYDR